MRLSDRIEYRPSPNYGLRVNGGPIDILLFHYTAMQSSEAALDWLCDEKSEVSSHYFVFEDGRVVCLVDEELRAYHAGVSFWSGEKNINSRSIGIELANRGHALGYTPFPEPQIEAVIELSRDILSRHPIPPERVLAHSDVAPLRKADPGELFPWQRLHAEGIGHFVPPAPIVGGASLAVGDRGKAVAALKRRFGDYGYAITEGAEFDAETKAVVTAFQRHFRPQRVDGIADGSTRATLDRLIAASARRRVDRAAQLAQRFADYELPSLRAVRPRPMPLAGTGVSAPVPGGIPAIGRRDPVAEGD